MACNGLLLRALIGVSPPALQRAMLMIMHPAGKWWAFEHAKDVRADIMCFAKGIASGFPTGGIALEPGLLDKMPLGVLGGTYGGGTLAHAAIHSTIGVIEGERLVDNAAKRGQQLLDGLHALQQKHSWPVKNIRGRGLMIAIEFDAEPSTASQVCISAKDCFEAVWRCCKITDSFAVVS